MRLRAYDIFAQREGGFAPQHAPSLVGQDQSVAIVFVAHDQLRRLKLPQHPAPARRRAVAAGAEGLELIVAMPLDRFGRLARQYVREMAEEEAPEVRSTAESAFCASIRPSIRRAVPWQTSQWPQGPASSPKGEQRLAAAARGLAKRDQIVELRLLDALALLGRAAFGDLPAAKLDVAGTIEGKRSAGSVASARPISW